MRVGLLVNPTAGRERAARYHQGLAGVLRRTGHQIIDLTGPDAASAHANARNKLDELDAVIVMGGDGSVQLGLNVVAETDTPLGIIPVGTGNDNASGLGLPSRPDEALKLILRQMRLAPAGVPTDAIRATTTAGTRWAMAALNCGFDADVNARANRLSWPKNGLRYVRAMLEQLPSHEPPTYHVTTEDWEWEGTGLLVAASNVGYIGGGMNITPECRIDDGVFDILIVDGGLTRAEFLAVFPRVFRGTHTNHPAVRIVQAREFRLTTDRQQAVFADGEPLGYAPVEAAMVQGAVRLYRPEGRPE